MTESDDQLGSLFFYMLVVLPITSWILHPGRFDKRKAIAYAVLFLAAIATAHVVYDLKEEGVNYYRMLGVQRSSHPSAIRKAFKRLSLELHPDKNSSPLAHEEFQRVKHAHDVLMDTELRESYNKMGEEGVEIAAQMVLDNQQLLIRLLVSYISQAIFSFIMTVSEPSGGALKATFTGLLVMSIVEGGLLFGQLVLPPWLFPQIAPFEIIWILHRIFPAFMNGCRAICGATYVNHESMISRSILRMAAESMGITHGAADMMKALQADLKEELPLRTGESLLDRSVREHRLRPTDPTISAECARVTLQAEEILKKSSTADIASSSLSATTSGKAIGTTKPERLSTFLGCIGLYLVAYFVLDKMKEQ